LVITCSACSTRHGLHQQPAHVKGIKPITTRTIERWYQSLSDDAGIKFTSHDIRKLARDSWQDMGIDWVIGEMLLNHERDGLDKRYMHTHSREQMRKALGKWVQKIIDISKP
jgi:hypothetical protein